MGDLSRVRGFDIDYIGLLWLDDRIWRDGQWLVQLGHVYESGIRRHGGRIDSSSRTEGACPGASSPSVPICSPGPSREWCNPDKETRDHVSASLVSTDRLLMKAVLPG